MDYLFLFGSVIVASLSFYGGVWLWKGIANSITFNFWQLFSGAFVLFASCLLISGFLFKGIYLDGSLGENLDYFVVFLALSLAYNSGYLYSILPRRNGLGRFEALFLPEFFILILSVILFVFIVIKAWGMEYLLFSLLGGSVAFFTGFFIWERLRQAEIFMDKTFRKTLWNLSLGFVLISLLASVSGLFGFYSDVWANVTAWSILLIFISLTFYCVGLLFALIQFRIASSA